MKPGTFPVNYSISPAASSCSNPLFGTASASRDLEDSDKEKDTDEIQVAPDVREDAPEVPEALEGEEATRPKVARRPVLPTKAEIDEHFPLHLHYRDWSRHCVHGKAKLAPHLVEAIGRQKGRVLP